MTITYTTFQDVNDAGTAGGDITSTSRTYNSGELIVAIFLGATGAATKNNITISNSAAAQTWTLIKETENAASDAQLKAYYCVMSTTQAMTISFAGDSVNTLPSVLNVIQIAGQHATTPVPAGNVFGNFGGTDISQSITPTASGSALWLIVDDWNQTNSYAAIANCTIDKTHDLAGQHTTALIRPTTQPRTDAAAFTIGETDTAGRISWIAFEVQAVAALGPTITSQPQSTNVVNGTTASFSVAANTSGGALSYQWQDNSGGSFSNVSGGSGATTPTYTTATTTSTFEHRQYRCLVTDSNGTTTSSTAVLQISWHDVYLYAMPEDANPNDVRLRDPTVFGASGTTSSSAVSSSLGQAASPVALTNAQAAVSSDLGQAASPVNATNARAAVSSDLGQSSAPTQAPTGAVSSDLGQASAPTQMRTGAVSSDLGQSSAPTQSPVAAVSSDLGQSSAPTQTPVSAVSSDLGQSSAPTQLPMAAVSSSLGQATSPIVDAGGGGTTLTSAAVSSDLGQANAPIVATNAQAAVSSDLGQANAPIVATNAQAAISSDLGQSSAPTQNPTGAVSSDLGQASAPTQTPVAAVSSDLGQASTPTETPVAAVSSDLGQAYAPVPTGAVTISSEAVSSSLGQAADPGAAGLVTIAVEAVSSSLGQAAAPVSSGPPPATDGRSAWLRTFLQELYAKEFEAQKAIREAAETARLEAQRAKPLRAPTRRIQAEPKAPVEARVARLAPIAPEPEFPSVETPTPSMAEVLLGVTPLPAPLRMPKRVEMPRGIGELDEDDVETLLTLAVAFDL